MHKHATTGGGMRIIGGLFGRSPFGPLREHILKVVDCVGLLSPLVKASLKGNQEEVRNLSNEISKEEHAADLIKKRLRDQLSKSLFTSISRAEILSMLKEQDSIADACEEAALLLAVRVTFLPEELSPLLIQMVEAVAEIVQLISEASEKLTRLEEDDSDKIVPEIYQLIEKVQQKEWETDTLQRTFLEKLFLLESKINPVDIYFLMNALKHMGDIADHADNTGDCMRRILAR